MKQLEFNEEQWESLCEAMQGFSELLDSVEETALFQGCHLGGPVCIERDTRLGITRICLRDEEDGLEDNEAIPRERVERLLERVRDQAHLWRGHQHKAYAPGQSLPLPEVWKVLECALEEVLSGEPKMRNVYWCPYCRVVHRKGICPVCSLGFPEDPEPVNEQEQEYASQNA